MIFQVGIENKNEGRSIAWALEHPGCFAYGLNGKAAALNLETAIVRYAAWIKQHDKRTAWLTVAENEIEVVINGEWEVYYINDNEDKVTEQDEKGYSVESFFQYDWKPLGSMEIQRGLDMLRWSREDLLKLVEGLSEEKLNATYLGERWSIKGILGHLGGAEYWYLTRLGLAFPRSEVPEEPLARLEKVRTHLRAVLNKFEGVRHVIGVDGEIWSPRKILRRTLWHERDHTEHIRKLL